ncbi:MAG: hypothetical protein MH204_12385 [Fimbriimonadaceae bacterium]|nr:hypothetical protein [Fimbriimonadaceae bacterium]
MSRPLTKIDREWQGLGLVLLVAGIALMLLVGSQSGFGPEFARAWFFGWFFWAGVTLGMTGLALLHHVVRAKWSAALYRVWEAGGGWVNLLVTGLLFAPVATIWGPEIYKWMRPEVVASDPIVAGKMPYLTSWFFITRWVVFFALLAFCMKWLGDKLQMEIKTGDKKYSDARNYWAGLMLVGYVLVINFAMTDWAMSLDVHWFSTIYGVWMMIGFGIAALSLAIMVIGTQSNKAPFADALDPTLLKDIGHMLLALTMVWGYFSLSQYLIIWSGNLPEFTVYYLARSGETGYNAVGAANIVGSFLLPFLLLVGPYSPTLKRNGKVLAVIAGLCFVFRFIDIHYILSPSLWQGSSWVPTLSHVAGLSFFGGIWFLLFVWRLRQQPLTVESHPYQVHGRNAQEAEHVQA